MLVLLSLNRSNAGEDRGGDSVCWGRGNFG